MPPFVLDVLKFAFLVLLYFFVYRALRVATLDVRGGTAGASGARAASAPKHARRTRDSGKAPRKLLVIDDRGSKAGTFRLEQPLQVGRADACQIRLGDTYISQYHARIYPRDGTWYVEDLGSTNGTYLNQRKLTGPSELHAGDRLRVGKTTLELRA